MSIDAFREGLEFKKDMDLWIRRFKSAEPIHSSQPVLIPGEPERLMQEVRLKEGIPLLEVVWEDIKVMAEKFDFKF